MKKVIKPLGVIFLLLLIALTGCKKSDSGTNSENPSTPTVPTGAINGLFTINDNGDQVYFSQGNLQYQASTETWRFAEYQWDYIGMDNENISPEYNGWIDLFGWGTGHNPTNTSIVYYDYSSFNDWGYNSISNGGNQTNQWRTLTVAELRYVFFMRSTTSGIRFAKAVVNGVCGVVLLPDNWKSSFYSLNSTDNSYADYSGNAISQSDWTTKFEANGAVFMPAAGFRSGMDVYRVGNLGAYWSAVVWMYDNNCAGAVIFDDSHLEESGNFCHFGLSVRLAYSAE